MGQRATATQKTDIPAEHTLTDEKERASSHLPRAVLSHGAGRDSHGLKLMAHAFSLRRSLRRSHHKNRAGRVAHDFLGNAAQHQATDAAAPMTGDHDQVGLPAFCGLHNFCRGLADL